MAKAAYRIFDNQNDTYTQVQRHSDIPTDTKNFFPKKDGTLVVEEDVAKFVVLIQQPEILEPENGTEDFMGVVKLSPYVPGESYAGKQTALRYQLALDEDFERLVGDNTLVTTGNTFKPKYGHNDETNANENHEDTAKETYNIIEDFDRSQAKIYVRAKYISDVNSSLWSESIYYITPDAYPVEPELSMNWDNITNVPQIITVNAKFKGLSSDGDTPSITLNSTDWILKKEDGTVVFESLNDTTNKTSFTFKNKFETNTTYTLEVKFHTDAGDSDVSTLTFTTASTWIELPEGMDFDNLVGDLRAGYLGKGEHGGSASDENSSYTYVGNHNDVHTHRSGEKYSGSLYTDVYKNDVMSYNGDLYKVIAESVTGPSNVVDTKKYSPYTKNIEVPNYQNVFDLIASFPVYRRSDYSVDNIKYLSDFDFGGVSGKFTKFEESLGFQYDETGVKEVTGYFVPTKKNDDEQAWNKGNEWYTIVTNGKVKYVSTVHFKYVSPFELGLCHLTGKGRTIRIGYHLWRVSIMTLQDAYALNKIFDGSLASEDPGYDDADENNITVEIVRNNEDTLTKYNYVRFGNNVTVKDFEPLSARLLDDKINGKKYYPSYRLVLEYIPESEEPWKPEHLSKINTGPQAANENLIYDKFTDTGYFGIVSGADLFTTDEINNNLTMVGEKVDFEQEWLKFYYHGKIIYIPMFMVRFNIDWENVIQSGWYVSTPYSSVISKSILNKNGKYFVGGLQSTSTYLLERSSTTLPNNYVNRSMFNETLLKVIPGFHGGVKLNTENSYNGVINLNDMSGFRGSKYSGSMQIGDNFVKDGSVYTVERMNLLPNTVKEDDSYKHGELMVLGSALDTPATNTHGTSTTDTLVTPRSWYGSENPWLMGSSYLMYNYMVAINNFRPIGSNFNVANSSMMHDKNTTGAYKNDGYFAFTPFLEQITATQKTEIDDFNNKVKTNVAKWEAHLEKIEEQRAIQAELERQEAEYLRRLEEDGVDTKYDGNIKTPSIVDPNALTRSASEPVSVDTLTGSRYIVGKDFTGQHTGSDVQYATDASFNNVIATVSTTSNATRIRVSRATIGSENFDKDLNVRLRYKSGNVTSEWSNPITGRIKPGPDLPSLALTFLERLNDSNATSVDTDADYMESFNFHGTVGEEDLTVYGTNRGTLSQSSHFPIVLLLGDRFVFKYITYRVIEKPGATYNKHITFNNETEINNWIQNGNINNTVVADIIDDESDVRFGRTSAWWAWYIGNVTPVITNTTGNPYYTNSYMVNATTQPTVANTNGSQTKNGVVNNVYPGEITNWFPNTFPNIITCETLTANVNVNVFSWNTDDDIKLIVAPDVPVCTNVNLWKFLTNYNAYAGQKTVRIGSLLFYKRLPYTDEILNMASAGALGNFNGVVLTLDNPDDNFANSSILPEKKVKGVIIKNGKYGSMVTITREAYGLYLPILEYIEPKDEKALREESKFGFCEYDEELDVGFYKMDTNNYITCYGPIAPNWITLVSKQNLWFYYNNMIVMYRNNLDNLRVPSPTASNPDRYFASKQMVLGIMNGYKLTPYVINGNNDSSKLPTNVPANPLKVNINNVTFYPCILKSSPNTFCSLNNWYIGVSNHIKNSIVASNNAFGILINYDNELNIIYTTFFKPSNTYTPQRPYYSSLNKNNLLTAYNVNYHGSGNTSNIGNWMLYFPNIYDYIDKRYFNFANSSCLCVCSTCRCVFLDIIYRYLK